MSINLVLGLKSLKKLTKFWYWLLVAFIWLAQLFYTIQSTNKIRLEELGESVRNVYWLQNRTIYDGISSNVGWYGTLLVLYNIFGFYLFEAKYFRLIIHLISLICLAKLLKKYGGEKKAWLPLLIIGLSPTLLYFNTLQTSFGIDLQYFPICLYILLSLDFSQPLVLAIKQFILWSLAMIAIMSYPTFLPYLSILVIIYILVLMKAKKILPPTLIFNNILISLISFCLPLIIVFSYLREPQLLIYDPHVKSGIFRGGGGGRMPNSLPVMINNIFIGTRNTMRDLFLFPGSFYFEADIARVEFSHKLLLVAVIVVLLISLWVFIKVKQTKTALFLSWLLGIMSLVIGNISGDLSGIRRSTGILVAFYAIVAIVWVFPNYNKRPKGYYFINLIIASALFLISFHHLKVYPNNLAALLVPSPHAVDSCFNKFPGNPTKSFDYFLNQVKAGQKINNRAEDKGEFVCRLHAVYAATASACLWNQLNCPPIYGYDENTGNYILLSTALWENYYFGH